MSAVHLFGASDDLIETRGAWVDEFDAHYGRTTTVLVEAVVPGVQHRVTVRLNFDYDNEGVWRIRPDEGSEGLVEIVPARGDGEPGDAWGCPGYSDRAVVRGGVNARVVGR